MLYPPVQYDVLQVWTRVTIRMEMLCTVLAPFGLDVAPSTRHRPGKARKSGTLGNEHQIQTRCQIAQRLLLLERCLQTLR